MLQEVYDRIGIVDLFCKDSNVDLLTRAHRNPVYKMVSFGGFCHICRNLPVDDTYTNYFWNFIMADTRRPLGALLCQSLFD